MYKNIESEIKLLIRNFSDFPDKIPREHYRWYVVANYTWRYALLFHILFIPLFFLLNVRFLAFFNIGSSILWIIVLRLHLKGNLKASAILGIIEVSVHQVMCVIFIGWNSGFQYYLMVIALGVFFMPFKKKFAGFLFTLLTVLYLMLDYYSLIFDPLTPLDPFITDIIRYSISMSVFLLLGLVSFYYNSAANTAEAVLEQEKIALRETLRERDEALGKLNQELAEAAAYVYEALPAPISIGPVKIDWRFIPSTSLGGDALGYHWIDDDHFAIYLIDVSGHGVGAALLSVSVINVLRSQSLSNADFKDPGQVLGSLNTTFPGEENNDMFFTIWYGIYNKNTRELLYASGGHPPALLLNDNDTKGSRVQKLRTPNFVIGGLPETTYQKLNQRIDEKSTLYIFSDGVYEVKKSDGTMWRLQEFSTFMQKMNNESQSRLDRLYNYVKDLGESDQLEDDFTIMEVVFC